jgi:hypothetical protein
MHVQATSTCADPASERRQFPPPPPARPPPAPAARSPSAPAARLLPRLDVLDSGLLHRSRGATRNRLHETAFGRLSTGLKRQPVRRCGCGRFSGVNTKLAATAARRGGCFGRRHAIEAGYSDVEIRAHLQQGRWTRLCRGAYAALDPDEGDAPLGACHPTACPAGEGGLSPPGRPRGAQPPVRTADSWRRDLGRRSGGWRPSESAHSRPRCRDRSDDGG